MEPLGRLLGTQTLIPESHKTVAFQPLPSSPPSLPPLFFLFCLLFERSYVAQAGSNVARIVLKPSLSLGLSRMAGMCIPSPTHLHKSFSNKRWRNHHGGLTFSQMGSTLLFGNASVKPLGEPTWECMAGGGGQRETAEGSHVETEEPECLRTRDKKTF